MKKSQLRHIIRTVIREQFYSYVNTDIPLQVEPDLTAPGAVSTYGLGGVRYPSISVPDIWKDKPISSIIQRLSTSSHKKKDCYYASHRLKDMNKKELDLYTRMCKGSYAVLDTKPLDYIPHAPSDKEYDSFDTGIAHDCPSCPKQE